MSDNMRNGFPCYVIAFREKARGKAGDGAVVVVAAPTKANRDHVIRRMHLRRAPGFRVRTEKISPTRVAIHATRAMLMAIFGEVVS